MNHHILYALGEKSNTVIPPATGDDGIPLCCTRLFGEHDMRLL
ncbi:Uncharacterised protein [Legionella cherrii]|uniref:Uncharacterized protein n=1 Tax=Legionella cherrii TaxID=28084 RepID=A0ABY6TAY3_9GAMM|nr:Uncharacterised protein [Legionella cherrii]